MTVPAPPAPAEKRPRKSAAGIAPRAAGVLLALLALVMAVGTIGATAQGDLGAGGAATAAILFVVLPGAGAAGLFRWAGRLDQRAADRPASAAAVFAPRIRPVPQVTRAPVPRVEPVRAPVLNPPPAGAGGGAPVSVPPPAAIPAAADSAGDPPQAGPAGRQIRAERAAARSAARQARAARREAERREREAKRAEEREQRRIAEEQRRRELRETEERRAAELARARAREEEDRARHGYMDGSQWVPPRPRGAPFRAWYPYGERVEVAGLSYREGPLRRLARRNGHRKGADAARFTTDLLLVPDPGNPYGHGSAVAVYLGEDHTGYLPQREADRMHRRVADLARDGMVLQVPARAWVGDVAMYLSAWLPAPDAVLPSNGLPEEPHAVLPPGRKIQVAKEDEHMDVLRDYVLRGSEADNHVAATLRSINEIRPRSSYEAVQVEIDGRRVGVLTKLQSDKLLPLVKHIEQRGLLPVARAAVKGTRLKADVVLDCVDAQTVEDDWLDDLGEAVTDANVDKTPAAPARPDFDWDDEED